MLKDTAGDLTLFHIIVNKSHEKSMKKRGIGNDWAEKQANALLLLVFS